MAFECVCGKTSWSRATIRLHYKKFCAEKPIPPGHTGISVVPDQNHAQDGDGDDSHDVEEGEEEAHEADDADEADEGDESGEDSTEEAAHPCRVGTLSNSQASSFGAEFIKAIEITRNLQKQSSELHQDTISRLMDLHRTAKERILDLRQELHNERSTRRLALRTLMDAQAAHKEERQEWAVERLSLLAHLETQEMERQESEKRISRIESRLKRSIVALGDDPAPYRTPPTSEDSPAYSEPAGQCE
ncbi:hypothetical protein EC968_000312 [Mortierella alpina]|nr:hypothetical protein EC968_000312 [Mortierella alpina]